MKIKEVLKKVIPPSANTFHSFVAESNAANDRKMHTLVSEINKAGRTNQEILEKINRINETGQEIIEKMNNKEYDIPASMKPPAQQPILWPSPMQSDWPCSDEASIPMRSLCSRYSVSRFHVISVLAAKSPLHKMTPLLATYLA